MKIQTKIINSSDKKGIYHRRRNSVVGTDFIPEPYRIIYNDYYIHLIVSILTKMNIIFNITPKMDYRLIFIVFIDTYGSYSLKQCDVYLNYFAYQLYSCKIISVMFVVNKFQSFIFNNNTYLECAISDFSGQKILDKKTI